MSLPPPALPPLGWDVCQCWSAMLVRGQWEPGPGPVVVAQSVCGCPVELTHTRQSTSETGTGNHPIYYSPEQQHFLLMNTSLPVRSLAKSKYNSDQFSPDYWNCECGVVQISSSEWNNDSAGLTFGYILLTLSVIKPPGEWSSQLNHFLPIFLRCSSFHFIDIDVSVYWEVAKVTIVAFYPLLPCRDHLRLF